MNKPTKRPWAYRRYLLIRGPKHGLPRLLQQTYTTGKRLRHPDLARLMEHPPTTQAPLLFYPGCYLYSPTIIRNTLKILDHIGIPYQTLGGLSYCCGLPHRLQGDTTQADACTARLAAAIIIATPQTIVTSCLECLEALNQIKTQTNAPYEVLHTLELIHRHRHKFPDAHATTPLLIHEPCRLAHSPHLKDTVIALAASLGQPVILLPSSTPSCCHRWNHKDPTTPTHHKKYLATATTYHASLVCPCLTCLEAFQKTTPSAPLHDLIDLFAASLDTKEMTP